MDWMVLNGNSVFSHEFDLKSGTSWWLAFAVLIVIWVESENQRDTWSANTHDSEP